MLFDFKATYASYTDEQLVQIAGNESGYQPAAVAAAKALLEERGITEENLQDMLFPRQPETEAAHTGMPQYEDGNTTIFEDVQRRPVSEQTKRRIKQICITWGILSAVNLISQVCNLYETVHLWGFHLTGFLSYLFAILAGVGLPFLSMLLLYRHKKWGWYLSVTHMVYYTLQLFFPFLKIFSSIPTDRAMSTMLFAALFPTALAFLVYMLMRQFRTDFSIPAKNMWWPLGIGLAISILPFVYAYIS